MDLFSIILISIAVVAILICLFVLFVALNNCKTKEHKDYMKYVNSQFKDLENHNENNKKLIWNKKFNRDKNLMFWIGFFTSIFPCNIYLYIFLIIIDILMAIFSNGYRKQMFISLLKGIGVGFLISFIIGFMIGYNAGVNFLDL